MYNAWLFNVFNLVVFCFVLFFIVTRLRLMLCLKLMCLNECHWVKLALVLRPVLAPYLYIVVKVMIYLNVGKQICFSM